MRGAVSEFSLTPGRPCEEVPIEAEWNEAGGPVRVEDGKASGSVSILPGTAGDAALAQTRRRMG